MSVGLILDRSRVDSTIGSIAVNLKNTVHQAQSFKQWLDTLTDQNLIDSFGYIQSEVDTLRSAAADLDQLRTIFEGSANLSVAKDFRLFVKRVWGIGV